MTAQQAAGLMQVGHRSAHVLMHLCHEVQNNSDIESACDGCDV
jgi:hypothetical protein